ncbi:histidine kinase [Paenibacillus amylolyticus]|uniref:GAF domain-containing sensor histidine kinase n=1 Tax=Paenibacillus amylolyticus TaxID=1451 RepID=UPI00096FBA78|nr:GAF domain-containing protein [Paenibacillus amylolyticus]OMF02022.1 histidine kinase [Paenibacillus amylolyticus]
MLKTEFIDVLSLVSHKLYDSAANVMDTASRLIPANTFCIAQLDHLSTKVLNVYNRDKLILGEGLVVDNAESYCALVTEHSQGPLVINNNLTHPLTRHMDATEFVGGCSFVGVPIHNENGEIYGSLCSFDQDFYSYQQKDVDLLLSLSSFFTSLLEMETTLQQLKQAEETAAKVLEEKKNLLAVLSHEIRTPMNGVLAMANLLQSTRLSEDQSLYVNVIESSGASLLSMMDQILDYSKAEAGAISLEIKPYSVTETVEHVLQLFSSEAQKKEIRLYAEYNINDHLMLMGDQHKVRQILINLVGNALKFTEKGEVCISTEVSADTEGTLHASYEIKDTGIGIPQDRQDLLFKSYSQIHGNSGKYGGAGLGLSICKQLAELMGGIVWLKESSPMGSRFVFNISSASPNVHTNI